MPCHSPKNAWYSKHINPTGKRSLVFSWAKGIHGLISEPIKIPCNQCNGCKYEHARQWAVRAHHEASLYPRNAFVTLTYNPEHLPENGSLNYRHPVLFMKRLRKKYGPGIRSYGCAEYGSKKGRPHYHILLFNHDFADKYLWETKKGYNYYRSPSLEKLWSDPETGKQYGNCIIADVTFQSAGYVARYVAKKLAPNHPSYEHIHPDTGEITQRLPERAICRSMRKGIGNPWLQKFKTDVYPSDSVIVNGKMMKPPKYYDSILSEEELQKIKLDRKTKAQQFSHDNTPARLKVKAQVLVSKLKQLPRSFEND